MKQVIHLLFVGLSLGAWQDGADIKSVLNKNDVKKVQVGDFDAFKDNPDDHLTLLGHTAESVFIGARDKLYNISLKDDLYQHSVVHWPVSSVDQDSCQFKGQSDRKCHNFLRLFHGPYHPNHPSDNVNSSTDSRYLLCGTNAFKPTCRWYSADLKSHSQEFSGVGYSPFDPTHQSTSVLHHDSVYSATVADFGGTDSLIYKRPLRTEQYYDLQINSPSFVSSRSFGDLALFFFREVAVEHSNCGKTVFSRVARICRHDNGGRKHRDRFTTFLKARLNCSVPGDYPFYFDHIQGTSEIFLNSQTKEEMMYAVFTTAPNSIRASAVCSFYMKDILKAFDGPFKGQSSLDSNWLPVPETEVPNPRPGQCSNDPSHQPDSNSQAFLKGHPLMDEAVQGTAVLTLTSNTDTFTSLTVDYSSAVAPFHIIYVGTESGKVFKAVVNANDSSESAYLDNFEPMKNLISQSWEIFPKTAIKSVQLINPTRLLVLTEREMSVVIVDNCDSFSSCSKCISIRDPHCGWSKVSQACVSKDPLVTYDANMMQNISSGNFESCPNEDQTNEIVETRQQKSINSEVPKSGEECCSCSSSTSTASSLNFEKEDVVDPTLSSDKNIIGGGVFTEIIIREQNESFIDNNIPRIGDNNKQRDVEPLAVRSNMISEQSVILATTSSAILSLLVGFSLGFLMCKLIISRQNKNTTSTNAQLAANLNESQRLTTTKQLDILVNVPNNAKNNFNTDTLGKPAVKKTYL